MKVNKWLSLAVVMTLSGFVMFIFLTYSRLPTDTVNLIIYFVINGCFGIMFGAGSTLGIYLHLQRWENLQKKDRFKNDGN
jgi:hypothetical protein